MITQERLKELFYYTDGHLVWKVSKAKRIVPGQFFGGVNNSTGYIKGSIDCKKYYEHRLIYLYHNGILPKYIDHINGIRADNRIENLRECTKSQNSMNSKKHKDNTTGYKGVSFHKQAKKYKAEIRHNNRLLFLGLFKSVEEAALAYDKKAIELFSEFARLNFPQKENDK